MPSFNNLPQNINLFIKNHDFRIDSIPQTSHILQQVQQKKQIPLIKNIFTNKINNQLSSKKQWDEEEDQLVYELHNQFGNKWAIIAQHLKNRTDNQVKNHFYSRLRKGLRKINKIIQDNFKKNIKQFKTIDLYKIIEASDQKFKEVKSFTNQMTDLGLDLKNRLFKFAQQELQQSQEYKRGAHQLVTNMSQFTKNYKRKSKKSRRYSPMGIDSIYRINARKNHFPQDLQPIEAQKSQFESESKQPEYNIKFEHVIRKNEINKINIKQIQQQKNKTHIKQIQKQPISLSLKKQSIIQNHNNESNVKSKIKNKDYRHFSDQQDQDKNQAEYIREQRLNHFAQNLLKTFKSYYSYRSFKSNSMIDEPFFE